MDKVIVTGGAGFIGSHLAGALIEKGYEVHIIDNLSGGKKGNVNSRAVFHQKDIRDFAEIAPIFKNGKYVFHLAARPRVQVSIQDPLATNAVNVDGTLNVLVAARDAKAKRLVFSSSSSVYGNQKTLPLRENMEANPLSPYGLHKLIGEQYCVLFGVVYGLEAVSLRYFNVYGPGMNPKGAYALAIGKFFEQRKKNKPLTITSDGKQSRDFTHVRDVARANLLAAESAKVGKGEVINIGAGENRTILEVADLIGGPKVFVEPRLEPKHTLADNKKARNLIGWKPEITLEEGMEELKRVNGINGNKIV